MSHNCTIKYLEDGRVNVNDFLRTDNRDDYDFEFEKNFNPEAFLSFCHNNVHLLLGISVGYLLIVFGLQSLMEQRKPWNVKWPMITWNLLIGVFSIVGFLRTAPELIDIWMKEDDPIYFSACIPKFTKRFITWSCIFAISKLPEFMDTVFLALQKKPIVPAQWFHHAATFFCCWTLSPSSEPIIRYPVVLNFAVHGIMYPYFALKLMRVQLPKVITKIVTTSQIAQMLIVLFMSSYSAIIYLQGTHFCHRQPLSVLLVGVVIVIFVVMFGKIFLNIVMGSLKSKKE